MPILTNHEVQEFRKLARFAGRLLDLIDTLEENNDDDLRRAVDDIAAELDIKLPLENADV